MQKKNFLVEKKKWTSNEIPMVLEFFLYLRFVTLSYHEMINTFIIIVRSESLLETVCMRSKCRNVYS